MVYLIFNEGYGGRGGWRPRRFGWAGPRRADARRARGPRLLALMLVNDARCEARFADGAVVLSAIRIGRWDLDQIAEGRAALDRALALGGRGPTCFRRRSRPARRGATRLAAARGPLRRARAAHRLAGRGAQPGRRDRGSGRRRGGARLVERLELDRYHYLHDARELLRRLDASRTPAGLRARARARPLGRRAALPRAAAGRARGLTGA